MFHFKRMNFSLLQPWKYEKNPKEGYEAHRAILLAQNYRKVSTRSHAAQKKSISRTK